MLKKSNNQSSKRYDDIIKLSYNQNMSKPNISNSLMSIATEIKLKIPKLIKICSKSSIRFWKI